MAMETPYIYICYIYVTSHIIINHQVVTRSHNAHPKKLFPHHLQTAICEVGALRVKGLGVAIARTLVVADDVLRAIEILRGESGRLDILGEETD